MKRLSRAAALFLALWLGAAQVFAGQPDVEQELLDGGAAAASGSVEAAGDYSYERCSDGSQYRDSYL